MTYKNGFKIVVNNFSLCWKQLVWILISILVVVGVSLLCAMPAIQMLNKNGFFVSVRESFETLYSSPKDYPSTVTNVFKMFVDLVKTHANTLWPSYVGAIASLVVLGNIFVCIGNYALTCVLASRMESNLKISFTNRVFGTLGKSIVYSLVNLLISIPFFAVIFGMFALYVYVAKTTVLTLALLPVFSIAIYVVLAIWMSLICCMIPIMIDGQKNPFKAFALSVKEVSKRFGRTFSSSLCVILTIVFVNLFVGFFTVFAGLLVTVPASFVFFCAYSLVTHFAVNGRNFYVSDLCVVNLK